MHSPRIIRLLPGRAAASVLALGTLLLSQPLLPAAETTSEITKNGITWRFASPVTHGQFVNGDYWVVGPVTVASVSPEWDGTRHGSMLDPVPSTGFQGYRALVNYPFDDTERANFPLEIAGTKSLVSTIGLEEPLKGGSATGVDKAAVLTVLESEPPAGTFRPPYVAGEKPLYNIKDVNYALVPLLQLPDDTKFPDMKDKLKEVWLQHGIKGDIGSSIIPQGNIPAYSRDAAIQISDLSLVMMIEDVDRKEYINRMIQIGIDLYHLHLDNGNAWRAYGGFGNGRKWPIIFAGLLLDNEAMKHPIAETESKNARGPLVHKFGEDGHTYYGKPTDAYPKGKPLFGQDAPEGHYELYKNTGRGPKDARDPEGLENANEYRVCCTSRTWPGYALAARLMGAVELWNHDAFFDYVDWWCEVEDRENHGSIPTFPSRFVEGMWVAYRHSEHIPGVAASAPGSGSAPASGTEHGK